MKRALLVSLGVVLAAAGAEVEPFGHTQFWVVPEGHPYLRSRGMLMMCPSHAHGTSEEAFRKLGALLREHPRDLLSSIWVCREDQADTLRRFAPAVDQVFVNPFVRTAGAGPRADELIWPGQDHSVLNRLRAARAHSGRARLVACIDLRGEGNLFGERRATFEEIEWLACAVIGAHFQGIVWRHAADAAPLSGDLDLLTHNLMCLSQELGKATPVNWVRSADHDVPVSAVATGRTPFVAALNPEAMVADGKGPTRLGLSPGLVETDCRIRLPEGTEAKAANRADGTPMEIRRLPGPLAPRDVQIRLRLVGGGALFAVRLSAGAIPGVPLP